MSISIISSCLLCWIIVCCRNYSLIIWISKYQKSFRCELAQPRRVCVHSAGLNLSGCTQYKKMWAWYRYRQRSQSRFPLQLLKRDNLFKPPVFEAMLKKILFRLTSYEFLDLFIRLNNNVIQKKTPLHIQPRTNSIFFLPFEYGRTRQACTES